MESLALGGRLEGAQGAYRLVRPVDELEIPASVQTVLAARVDRLAEREKYLLQTASVIGPSFGRDLLGRLVELPEPELAAALRALEDGNLIRSSTRVPDPQYEFVHPLTHEVAYGSQLRESRARIHVAVARALEELFADRLGEQAALLAQHYDAAGWRFEARRWRHRAALRVSRIQLGRRGQSTS